jgi:hypothetical protein
MRVSPLVAMPKDPREELIQGASSSEPSFGLNSADRTVRAGGPLAFRPLAWDGMGRAAPPDQTDQRWASQTRLKGGAEHPGSGV